MPNQPTKLFLWFWPVCLSKQTIILPVVYLQNQTNYYSICGLLAGSSFVCTVCDMLRSMKLQGLWAACFLLPLMHIELVPCIHFIYDTDTLRYFPAMKYPNLWSSNTFMMIMIYYFLLRQFLRNVILIWICTKLNLFIYYSLRAFILVTYSIRLF